MADKQEYLISPRRRSERDLLPQLGGQRAELVNRSVGSILYSLSISTPELPELAEVQARAERQAQATLSAMNTPMAEPWVTSSMVYGSDGASTAGASENYPAALVGSQPRQAEFQDAVGVSNGDTLRGVTGMSQVEEFAMEANATLAAHQPTAGVEPQPVTQIGSLEDEARRLIDDAFGTQGRQYELT